MDSLQRRCFAASTGLHLLLGGILVFGPAFFSLERNAPRSRLTSNSDDLLLAQIFTLVPEPSVSRPTQPASAAPAPMGVPTQPQPATPAPKASRSKPLPSTESNPATSPKSSKTKTTSRDPRAEQFEQIIKDIREGTSPATKVELGINVAGSGGNDAYAQYVREKYTANWDLSNSGTANDSAVVKVAVTISNDGKVLSTKIIDFSGNADVDRSVERTLAQVSTIRPFGEGANDTQRTYTINFRCNAKGD